MSFLDAVTICLIKKYAQFQGRACRAEFWWFVLFFLIIFVLTELSVEVFWYLLTNAGLLKEQTIPTLVGLALPYLSLIITCLILITPLSAVTVRRLHDVNKSGKLVILPTAVMLVSICIAVGVQALGLQSLILFGAALSSLAGILAIACFIMTMLKGTEGTNLYGEDPLR